MPRGQKRADLGSHNTKCGQKNSRGSNAHGSVRTLLEDTHHPNAPAPIDYAARLGKNDAIPPRAMYHAPTPVEARRARFHGQSDPMIFRAPTVYTIHVANQSTRRRRAAP